MMAFCTNTPTIVCHNHVFHRTVTQTMQMICLVMYSQFLVSVIRNSLPFDKYRQKLANSDATKEPLNCTASLQQLTTLLMPLVSSGVLFCDPETSSPQIWIRLWPDLSF